MRLTVNNAVFKWVAHCFEKKYHMSAFLENRYSYLLENYDSVKMIKKNWRGKDEEKQGRIKQDNPVSRHDGVFWSSKYCYFLLLLYLVDYVT